MKRNYFSIKDFIRESLRIEDIHREPTSAEIAEAERFDALKEVQLQDLEQFVSIYQPGAKLRTQPGMNVYIGDHCPPRGGPEVLAKTCGLLQMANDRSLGAYDLHHKYESLHPFLDCNGRSGRMLWYWMMKHEQVWMRSLGFLHSWYYQSLAKGPR